MLKLPKVSYFDCKGYDRLMLMGCFSGTLGYYKYRLMQESFNTPESISLSNAILQDVLYVVDTVEGYSSGVIDDPHD